MANNKVGRKRFEDEAMERKNISLNKSRKELLEEIGDGNLSKGIRILADVYKNNAPVRTCVKKHAKDSNKT